MNVNDWLGMYTCFVFSPVLTVRFQALVVFDQILSVELCIQHSNRAVVECTRQSYMSKKRKRYERIASYGSALMKTVARSVPVNISGFRTRARLSDSQHDRYCAS